MKPFLTVGEARKITRPAIVVGGTYTFYSDCVGCKTDNDRFIREYSGQPVTVLERLSMPSRRAGLVKVRAANGDTFDANDGELNGWIFDTGQWVGPRTS